MKKIVALALALVMALSLGSVAFAATANGPCPVVIDEANGLTCQIEVGNEGLHLLPGEKYALLADDNKDLKVSAEWTKGVALVAGIFYDKKGVAADYNSGAEIPWRPNDWAGYYGAGSGVEGDGKGVWVLELKENFTITEAKDLEGEIVISYKDLNGDKKTDKVPFKKIVSNHLTEVYGEEDADDAMEIEAIDNTLYQCAEDEEGFVKFNRNALLGCTLNMASKEKAFMYNDEEAIETLTDKFPDADIECYRFGGSPKFKNPAKFTLQADYANQYYVYTYKNGKLEKQDYDWNSVEGVYEWETNAPTNYVISDVELVAAAEEETTKNPDTGANDVVGVAAALAVVSLAAAGAVSLKK